MSIWVEQQLGEPDLDPRSDKDENISDFNFQVRLGPQKMFGEAYHVLICCLLYQHDPKYKIRVHMVEPDPKDVSGLRAFEQIRKLFEWYSLSPTLKGIPGSVVSKSKATDMIVALFRSADGQNQKVLFDRICDLLNNPRHQVTLPVSETGHECLMDYFKATGQDLPKSEEVFSLAVIHIRRGDAETAVGRIMDATTLKYVEKSIADVNELCSRMNDHDRFGQSRYPSRFRPFTHVMLYGDFDRSEGVQMVKEMAKSHGNMKFSHVSGPWRQASNADWSKSHSEEYETIPTQAKILGIWAALRQVYQDKVCVIGHRSGFIEAAGLIGLPIFYLNNERDEYPASFGVKNPLWKRVPDAHGDRLRGVSDALSTFIPIEVLKVSSNKSTSSKRTLKLFSKKPKTSTEESEAPEKKFEIDPDHQHDLTAALFMYMCCPYVMDLDYDKYRNHAWEVRIEMIHDECEHDAPRECDDAALARGEKPYQTGEEWLRRRYDLVQSFVQRDSASWQPPLPSKMTWGRLYAPVWKPKKGTDTTWAEKGLRGPSYN
ncbi:hypothetical protein G7054_g13794 [Neopestalotiopsis clavispora]|nr:hypothetical protein G7054_g13794 [Neopestalotiopsis clavispora]